MPAALWSRHAVAGSLGFAPEYRSATVLHWENYVCMQVYHDHPEYKRHTSILCYCCIFGRNRGRVALCIV